jgi:hypothetical protein
LAIRYEHSQVAIESNTNEFYLNSTICDILIDNNWWETIEPLQSILLPYCGVLNKLQSDKACLFEVLHAMGYFINYWNNFFDLELGVKMIEHLEKHWKQWEQPLFLLSFMLHPKYRFAYFNSNVENLSFTYLGKYLTYYYKAWFNKRPTRLLLDFEDYRQKSEPFDDDAYNQFNNDVYKYWRYILGDYKELASVALKIFGICINAASVERMWSSMGFLHTNRRNWLTVSTNVKDYIIKHYFLNITNTNNLFIFFF